MSVLSSSDLYGHRSSIKQCEDTYGMDIYRQCNQAYVKIESESEMMVLTQTKL